MNEEISFDRTRCIKCGRCVSICPAQTLSMTDAGPEVRQGKCMACLQCAAICPREAVLFKGQKATVPEPFDNLENLIMHRRSIRHYKPEPPNREVLQWALDCAAWAPSGGNLRPTKWSVVLGLEEMEKVKEEALVYCEKTRYAPELLQAVEKGRDPLTCGATAMIAGLEPASSLNHSTDTLIALTTAELLLVSRGYGTCWGGYMRRISDLAPALRQLLAVPEGWHICGCLLAGIPFAQYPNIPRRSPADIHWVSPGELKS